MRFNIQLIKNLINISVSLIVRHKNDFNYFFINYFK
jgi:hypothetical protein